MNRKSIAGVHEVKASPNKLWFRNQLRRLQMTQKQLGEALAHELKLEYFDEAQISRRLNGRNRWGALECQALAKIFGVPLAEVMMNVGGAHENPVTGTIDDTGRVIFNVASKEQTQSVTFVTTNALSGAALTLKLCPKKTTTVSGTGVYAVQTTEKEVFHLRQVLGRVAGDWVLADFLGEPKLENAKNVIFVAKALHLQFA